MRDGTVLEVLLEAARQVPARAQNVLTTHEEMRKQVIGLVVVTRCVPYCTLYTLQSAL